MKPESTHKAQTFDLIDEIEREDCVCGAGTQKDLPSTWAFCGLHHRLSILRQVCEASLAGRIKEKAEATWEHVFQGIEEPCGCENHRKLFQAFKAREDAVVRTAEEATALAIADDIRKFNPAITFTPTRLTGALEKAIQTAREQDAERINELGQDAIVVAAFREAAKVADQHRGTYSMTKEAILALAPSAAVRAYEIAMLEARREEAKLWKPTECQQESHHPLRNPICRQCQRMARWEERIANFDRQIEERKET